MFKKLTNIIGSGIINKKTATMLFAFIILLLFSFNTMAGMDGDRQTGFVPKADMEKSIDLLNKTIKANSTILEYNNNIKLLITWYNLDIITAQTYIRVNEMYDEKRWKDHNFYTVFDHYSETKPPNGTDLDLKYNPGRKQMNVFIFTILNPDRSYIKRYSTGFLFKKTHFVFKNKGEVIKRIRPESYSFMSNADGNNSTLFNVFTRPYRDIANSYKDIVNSHMLYVRRFTMGQMFRKIEEGTAPQEIIIKINNFNNEGMKTARIPVNNSPDQIIKARDRALKNMRLNNYSTRNIIKEGRQFLWSEKYRRFY